jgi:peroxiredoxin
MPLDRGERAPAFRLRGIDNETWILGDPDRRRCVLLAFLRRDVSACRTLLQYVERLHRRARINEAEILGFSLDNHRDTLELAADYSFTFPILIEESARSTFAAYRVAEVPTLYLLGPDLEVLDHLVGWSKEGFERIARAYLDRSGALQTHVWEPTDLPPEAAQATAVGRVSGRTGTNGA